MSKVNSTGASNQALPGAEWTIRGLKRVRRPARSLRVTRVGLAVMILIVLILLAALNTGTNLLYLMLSTLLAFWILSIPAGTVNTIRIKVTRKLPGEIHAGESVPIEYEAVNSKLWLASYGVGLRDLAGEAGITISPVNFLALEPKSRSVRSATAVFPRRGWANLEGVMLSSRFPFALLDVHRWLALPARILVYPQLIPAEPLVNLRAMELGIIESPVRGAGSNLYSIRDYAPGDPAKAIHWKLSSKGTGIKVREFEREEARRIRLVFDLRLPQSPTAVELEFFERGISVTAWMTRYFIELGFETSLWTPAGSVSPGSGVPQLRRIMRALALVEADAFHSNSSAGGPLPESESSDVLITRAVIEGSFATAKT